MKFNYSVSDATGHGRVLKGDDDLGFSFRATKDGVVTIHRGGRAVTVLRGAAAQRFLAKAHGASIAAQQQLMARVTGNYKRGNEHSAADA